MNTLQQFFMSNLYTPEHNVLLGQYRQPIEKITFECTQAFYDVLLNDSASKRFITNELVESHLTHELQQWLNQTLSPKTSDHDIQNLINKQRLVGEVHSRIEVPMTLVNNAMSSIKFVLFNSIRHHTDITQEHKTDLIILLNQILDSGLSLINEAYIEDRVSNERHAQEYRTRSNAHEMAIEIERVKGALFGWMTQFMADMLTGINDRLADIHHQEFALWIRHKLSFFTADQRTVKKIRDNLDNLQNVLNALHSHPDENKEEKIRSISALSNECGWMLGQIADSNIEHATREDMLTSLIERRFMAPILQSETQLALKTHEPYSIMMIDVDNFKSVNDIHGHQAGDAVLSSIGRLLKRSLRVTDYAFRFGGEEFMILMPETSLSSAERAAEKLLDTIRKNEVILDNGRTLKATISIGLAQFNQDPDYQQVIKVADEKLYVAKHNGKDRYAV